MNPGCLPCAAASPPTVKRPVGRSAMTKLGTICTGAIKRRFSDDTSLRPDFPGGREQELGSRVIVMVRCACDLCLVVQGKWFRM